MSVSNTAKEVVRIAITAGLANDVIDLMEKKLAILTSELDTATDKFALVEKRVSELESQRTVVFSRIVPAPWVNTKRMSAAPIKASFVSLAMAALVSGFVVAYAQSGDLANCARIRVVWGGWLWEELGSYTISSAT